MKNVYIVTFEHSANVYCTNIAIAECIEDVEAHYAKYAWKKIRFPEAWEVKESEAKGMPVIECAHIETEEAEEAEEDEEDEHITLEEATEQIAEIIDNMNQAETVQIWNEYCNESNYTDDMIYPMNEFDEIMEGSTPLEIARRCFYSSKFCPAHDWFWFNGYGNCESSDYPSIDDDSPLSISCMIDFITSNRNPLCNDEIEAILSKIAE